MDFDHERLAEECEKVVSRMRVILKNKGGPVIMNSLAFVLAEAMFNVSNPTSWDSNLKNVFSAVEEHLKTFAAVAAEASDDAP